MPIPLGNTNPMTTAQAAPGITLTREIEDAIYASYYAQTGHALSSASIPFFNRTGTLRGNKRPERQAAMERAFAEAGA